MRLKKIVTVTGMSGVLAAGILLSTTGSALAATNYYIGNYPSFSSCQKVAQQDNANQSLWSSPTGKYYYCASGPNGTTNLWEEVN